VLAGKAGSKGLKRQLRQNPPVPKVKDMTGRKRSKIVDIAERSLRAGRLEGIIDAPKSGRWGDWEYYMRGKTQCCRRHVERKDPRTPAQRRVRIGLGGVAKAWGAKLTQEQRQAWELVAKQQSSKPRLAQAGRLEGEQLFVRHGTVLKKVGKELPLWPAPRPAFVPNPVAALSITQGSEGVNITLRVSGPVTDDIMVLGQAPCSAGRKKWRRGAYLCLLHSVEGGECDITAEYVEHFGQPEPGQKVFIRTQQQRDGWRNLEKDVSEVVPAKAETEAGETARLGARVALNELDRLSQLHKLQELQGLHNAGGARRAIVGRRIGEGRGVRCTRGWFRVGAASLPCHYRWGERGRRHSANGKWQMAGVGGRHAKRHWRELWHGS
jgi:hypothetical protein